MVRVIWRGRLPTLLPGAGPVHLVQVSHLLLQEKDSLLLQRSLDLRQTNQGASHLEVSRHLGDAMTRYLLSLLVDPVGGLLHLLGGPAQHVGYQVLFV